MLSLLFTICMIWFVGKFFVFGLRASWGIMKLLCTVIFFPVILIGMVLGGLMYIVFPLLIVGGIIALQPHIHNGSGGEDEWGMILRKKREKLLKPAEEH